MLGPGHWAQEVRRQADHQQQLLTAKRMEGMDNAKHSRRIVPTGAIETSDKLLRGTLCQIHQIRVFGSFDIVLREAS